MSKISVDSMRIAAAYHEAGHAVAGIYNGWEVVSVEIDPRWYTRFRMRPWDSTERKECIVDLAGWLAECKYHKRSGPRSEADILETITLIDDGSIEECAEMERQRASDEAHFDGYDDLTHAVLKVQENNPGITDDVLVERVLAHQAEAADLVEEKWSEICAIAQQLIEHGKLDNDRVEAIICEGGA